MWRAIQSFWERSIGIWFQRFRFRNMSDQLLRCNVLFLFFGLSITFFTLSCASSKENCRNNMLYGVYTYKSWNSNYIVRFEFRLDDTFSFSSKSGMEHKSAQGKIRYVGRNTFVLNTYYDTLQEQMRLVSQANFTNDTIRILPRFRISYQDLVLKKVNQ